MMAVYHLSHLIVEDRRRELIAGALTTGYR